MKINKYDKSAALYQRALKVIPAGVYGHQGPGEGCAIPISAFPIFSSRAKGSHFWDADGNRFVDFMCAYGPNILGYNDDDVDAAAAAQLKLGNCITTPHEILVPFAELMVDTVETADWAFFAKNGGDVTALAVMTAKAATGRDKVIMVNGGYHGVAPWMQKLGCGGVSRGDVENNLYVNWNDIEGFKKVVEENKGKVAAFISTPYHHPTFVDNEFPAPGYWNAIRKICTDNGIVLIIDDVRAGFRLDLKGSDHHFGFKADLICFCKAIANGYNVSALCGIDALRSAVTDVYFTGSYWLSAEPFAAGIACINKMRNINVPKICKEQGIKLQTGLVKAAKENGFNLIVTGEPAMWYMRLENDFSSMIHQEWVAECVKRGVFVVSHHNNFINAALSDEDINFTHEVADEAYKVIRKNHPDFR